MFSPTITHESTSVPGVRFTVHRMGFGRRAELDQKTLALRQRLRELEVDYPPQSPREKELAAQLEIASKKYLAVPPEEAEAVLKADVEPLARELEAAAAPEARKRRKVLDEEYASVQSQIHCAWIRFGLISIEGGEFDGMTAEQLLAVGPPQLAREIFTALATDGKTAGPEAENLKSAGTSGAAVPTGTTNTTAPAVAPEDGSRSAIASGIIQAA